ncbi:uncharacterized protein [Eurosta solidaginis]|uniref:uncharacterized protein n=1 Tax=Eurosta solidaginis TaxID=178769 RepID=UPI0035315930
MGPEPVYQPTTVSVSYEPRPGGINGNRSIIYRCAKSQRFEWILLVFGFVSFPFGVAFLVGAVASVRSEFFDTDQTDDGVTEAPVGTCYRMPILLIATGVLLMTTGLLALVSGLYVAIAHRRRLCPLFNKEKSFARQLQCKNRDGCGGEGIMALNPSTDPLVSHTQYAPVSELAHRCDEEESRNLMPDTKDCLSSAEESDRMLEPDPRIVLRPLGRVDDA